MMNFGVAEGFHFGLEFFELAVFQFFNFPAGSADHMVMVLSFRLQLEAGDPVTKITAPYDSSLLKRRKASVNGYGIKGGAARFTLDFILQLFGAEWPVMVHQIPQDNFPGFGSFKPGFFHPIQCQIEGVAMGTFVGVLVGFLCHSLT